MKFVLTRMTQIVHGSPSVAARSVTLEMLEPTQLCSSWSRFSLTVYSLKRAHASTASTSRTSILICPCRTLNMFGSKSWIFWKNLSTNTTWLVGTKMVGYTLKSARAAMAFLRLVYLQTTSSILPRGQGLLQISIHTRTMAPQMAPHSTLPHCG